jgi:Mrp family chromosome partitioning ATPase
VLEGEAMERLIKQQGVSYDYVIIDGPPVLLASEAKMLARCVDGTILVFNAAATRRGAAGRTISELRQVNAEILGCVLLGVKTLKGGYFREMFESYREYQPAVAG